MKARPATLRAGFEGDVSAMRGNLIEALARLEAKASELHNSGLTEDAVWLRLKRAELLSLDGHKEEALAEFEQHVVPFEPKLQIADRTVIGRNRGAIGIVLNRPEGHREFYKSADLDTSINESPFHMRDLLRAERASRERQHYDSLPALWRELVRCYRDCDLIGRIRAHERMAWETLAAGWAVQSVHHSVLGHSEKGVRQLADSLIAWRRLDVTHSVTDYLLTNCYLAEHLGIAAVALRQLADVVPDELMPRVFGWVEGSLSRPVRNDRLDPWAIKVWEAVGALTPRFSSAQVEKVIEIALIHSLFQTPGWGRKAIIRTLIVCVHNVKDIRWEDLAEACIPLCTSARWDADYDDALDLIMAIASHSEEAKVLIANNLVPAGSPSRDLRMMVVAHELGRKVDPDGLRRLVAITAERISKQVQHDAETDEPSKLSYHAKSVFRGPKSAVAVEIHSGILELEGVAAWKDELSSDDLSPLTTSMLRVMADRANLATNRVMLMQFLGAFAERLSPELCRQIAEALEPFARGAVPASIHDAQKTTTVDRFQMKTTTQEEQQANAVRILFQVLSVHSLKPDGRLVNLLAVAFAHRDFHVRWAACHAMSQSTDLLVPLAVQLLLAIQDPTEEVSGAALLSTASLLKKGMLRENLTLICALIKKGAASASPKLRRFAMFAARAVPTDELSPSDTAVVEEILAEGKTDLHFSVRAEASWVEP